jgi:hypothetical protein
VLTASRQDLRKRAGYFSWLAWQWIGPALWPPVCCEYFHRHNMQHRPTTLAPRRCDTVLYTATGPGALPDTPVHSTTDCTSRSHEADWSHLNRATPPDFYRHQTQIRQKPTYALARGKQLTFRDGRYLQNLHVQRLPRLPSYKTIILPVVLYGCETWPLTLREQHRLRVFENRVLRRIFGPKKNEVKGQRRKLHCGELHNLYSPSNIIRQIKSRRMRWAGHVARIGVRRKA